MKIKMLRSGVDLKDNIYVLIKSESGKIYRCYGLLRSFANAKCSFNCNEINEKDYDRLLADKLRKGYEEFTSSIFEDCLIKFINDKEGVKKEDKKEFTRKSFMDGVASDLSNLLLERKAERNKILDDLLKDNLSIKLGKVQNEVNMYEYRGVPVPHLVRTNRNAVVEYQRQIDVMIEKIGRILKASEAICEI